MSVQIKQTDDKELLDEIINQLKDNDGYCPCHLTKEPEDKCMCEEFRNTIKENKPGIYECTCGRYIATIT
jgi:hypothetical protein